MFGFGWTFYGRQRMKRCCCRYTDFCLSSSELFWYNGVHVFDVHACVSVCDLQLCVLLCRVFFFFFSKHMFTLSLRRDSGPSEYLLLWFHQLMSLSDGAHTKTRENRHAHVKRAQRQTSQSDRWCVFSPKWLWIQTFRGLKKKKIPHCIVNVLRIINRVKLKPKCKLCLINHMFNKPVNSLEGRTCHLICSAVTSTWRKNHCCQHAFVPS